MIYAAPEPRAKGRILPMRRRYDQRKPKTGEQSWDKALFPGL